MNLIYQVKPKFYADYNKNQPKQYCDYGNFENQWNVNCIDCQYIDQYESVKKLEEQNTLMFMKGQDFHILKSFYKLLKPVKKRKIQRETIMLLSLKRHLNIIRIK